MKLGERLVKSLRGHRCPQDFIFLHERLDDATRNFSYNKPMSELPPKTRRRTKTSPEPAASPPMTRHRGKATPARVSRHNHQLMENIFSELDNHSKELEEHSKKAAKLAETIKEIKTTVKVAGRTVPNKTHYTQTITKKSDKPFEKT